MKSNLIKYNKKGNAFYYKILIVFICCIESFLLIFSVFAVSNFENITYRKITDLNYEITAKVGDSVSNMRSMIENFCDTIYLDVNVSTLMYNGGNLSDLQVHSTMNRVTNLISSYSVIDSVIIYNDKTDTFYSTMDSHLKDPVLSIVRSDNILPGIMVRTLSREAYNKEERVLTYFKTESFYKGSNVVIINVKLDWLEKLLSQATPDTTELFLVDSDHSLIMKSSSAANMDEFQEEYLKDIEHGRVENIKNIQFLRDGDNVFMFCNVPDTDWYLINKGSYDDIYNSVNVMKRLAFVLTVISLIIGVFIAILAARLLYRPIKDIVSTIEASFMDLKMEKSTTDIQYISDAISYSKSFSGSLDSYLFKEMLSSNGKIGDEAMARITANNERLKGSFSVILILTEIMELSGGTKEYIKSCFKNADCDFTDISYDKLLIMGESSEGDVLYEAVKNLPEDEYSVCISEVCASIEDILNEYQELVKLSKYKLINGRGGLISRKRIKENENGDTFSFPDSFAAKLISALENGSTDGAKESLHGFLNALEGETISNYYMALTKLLLMLVEKYPVLSDHQSKYLDTILNAKVKSDIITCFNELFEKATESSPADLSEPKSLTVRAIRDYIHNHYVDSNLSVKLIAAEFKMSQAYIGRLFKKSYGCAIAEYINKLRIEKSLELLKNTNRSISDIMHEVGYENESTFFKIFKSYCNITPKGYRISLAEKDE